MAIYSFGTDSPLKIELTDQDAEFYNIVMEKLLEDPDYEFETEEALLRWSRINLQICQAIPNCDRTFRTDEFHSDFLVKN